MTDAIAFGALALLFSQGISDVSKGVAIRRGIQREALDASFE